MSYTDLFKTTAAGAALIGLTTATQAQDIPTSTACVPIKFEAPICSSETTEPMAFFSSCSTNIISMALIDPVTGTFTSVTMAQNVWQGYAYSEPEIREFRDNTPSLLPEDITELDAGLKAIEQAKKDGFCSTGPVF